MTLRSRLATPELVPVAKVFGPGVPAAIRESEAQQQMTPDSPFSPGEPIGPYDGYSRTPRSKDYVTSYNIATRPRLHERVSFETLKGLIGSYDVAGIAIWHRIDSLRSVKYRLNAADGYNGDITGAVDIATQVLRKPDRKHNFKAWFGKWMWDVLAYDAGALYRMRNRAGHCVGLMPVDGTTLAPLLDYWGNEPDPPAESHVQYANGLPWNWLTRNDLIYEPMRAVNDSIYGRAPIETIILNANTDIRFQLHFLQRFTEGNVPAAFASAPESWSPDQIEQFQELWDSVMYGDQSRKSQIRWLPGGSTFTWTNEKDFTDQFSLFMMRKTCACFHVVPTDLGFTDNSNYSTGESQADVAHKVGELPLMEYVEEILSQFLYDDLGLPLKFEFDRGEDQDDRLVQAQADDIYIKNSTVTSDEIREMRYGLPRSAVPVPRAFFSERAGPIPLASLMGVGGRVDPETGAPVEGAPLPHEVFTEVPGVIPEPPVLTEPLAEREYGPSALPPAPPEQPGAGPVAKDGEAGITSDTGIYGDPLERDEDEDERAALAKAELAAFRRYTRSRRKAGSWRDFRFEHTGERTARALNDAARAGHQPVAKGVAKSKADEVFHQMSEDYPKAALEWVHQAVWEGPLIVPFAELNMSSRDSWRASHEPDRIKSFADRIRHRTGKGKSQLKKPAVVIYEPGEDKALIVDGHHRTLGAQQAGEEGVLAWVGHVASKDGPWLELHNMQFTHAGGSAAGSGDDVAADQVGKAATVIKAHDFIRGAHGEFEGSMASGAHRAGDTVREEARHAREEARRATEHAEDIAGPRGIPLARDITAGERSAVDDYAGGKGGYYRELNGGLRKGQPVTGRAAQIGQQMHSLVDRTPPSTEPVTLFRSGRLDPQTAALLRPGTVLRDKGWVSTGTDEEDASGYMEHYLGRKDVTPALFRIQAPAGMKALDVDGIVGRDKGEHEVILPPGSAFRVTGVKRYGAGDVEVDVEMVPGGR